MAVKIRIWDERKRWAADVEFPHYDGAHDFFQAVPMPSGWTTQTLELLEEEEYDFYPPTASCASHGEQRVMWAEFGDEGSETTLACGCVIAESEGEES